MTRPRLQLTTVAILACGSAALAQSDGSATPRSAVAFPHPLISEVLFNVPRGQDGDANRDGVRSSTGDEFVEVVNPHDKPINLKGYRLMDGTSAAPRSRSDAEADPPTHFSFTFPDVELLPGEIAVVFNGFESAMKGEVGSHSAAAKKHPDFHDAFVFSAQMTSQYAALSNQHDIVQLLSPQGASVHTVRWDYRDDATPTRKGAKSIQPSEGGTDDSARSVGDERTRGDTPHRQPARRSGTAAKTGRDVQPVADKHAEAAGGLIEVFSALTGQGSMQRRTTLAGGGFVAHADVWGQRCSPGERGAGSSRATPTKDVPPPTDASKPHDPDD